MGDTIARFHKGPVLRTAVILASFMVLLFTAVLYTPDGHIVRHFLSPGPLMYPIGIFGTAVCLWTLYLCISAIEKVVFEDGKALWIKNGRVVYLNKFLLSADFKDIEEITTGTYGRYKRPSIVLRMRNGRRKIFPTTPLVESSDHIIARLKENLTSSSSSKPQLGGILS